MPLLLLLLAVRKKKRLRLLLSWCLHLLRRLLPQPLLPPKPLLLQPLALLPLLPALLLSLWTPPKMQLPLLAQLAPLPVLLSKPPRSNFIALRKKPPLGGFFLGS
ncbi:MAG: hypothetical protein ABIV07_00220 [Polaromonas sp.]